MSNGSSEVKVHIFVNKGVGREAIWFYQQVFGAREVSSSSHKRDMDTLLTSELRIGQNIIVVSELDSKSNLCRWIGGVPNQSAICVEVKGIKIVVYHAIEYEAVVEQDVTETNLGWVARIRDPFGNPWMICEMRGTDMPASEDMPAYSFRVATKVLPYPPKKHTVPMSKGSSDVKVHIFVNKGVGREAIWFYQQVFGAREVSSSSQKRDMDTLLTSELRIGQNIIVVSELHSKSNLCRWIGGVPNQSAICVEVKGIKTVVYHAIEYEAVVEQDVTETHLGWVARIRDPFGNPWMICEMRGTDMPASEDMPTSSFRVATPADLVATKVLAFEEA